MLVITRVLLEKGNFPLSFFIKNSNPLSFSRRMSFFSPNSTGGNAADRHQQQRREKEEEEPDNALLSSPSSSLRQRKKKHNLRVKFNSDEANSDDDDDDDDDDDARGDVHPSTRSEENDRNINNTNNNDKDAFVLLLSVSITALVAACYFLEKYAYLLRPLVFACGIALCLQPIVDFCADKAYQAKILRKWRLKRRVVVPQSSESLIEEGEEDEMDEEDEARTRRRRSAEEEEHLEYERERSRAGCVLVVPRPIAIFIAIFFVVVFLCTFLFALYLGQTWIVSHLHDNDWDERFKDRIQIVANFLDDCAKKIFKEDHVAVDAWQTRVDEVESWLKNEDFWTQVGTTVFRYFGDVCLCGVYSMFLLVPERQPLRFKKPVVKRTVVAVRKFMNIMIVLALFRAALVSCVLYFCGVPLILAASLAIASFWLYFIPTVGSLISFALPVPIALLLPDLTSSARWCACIFPSFASAIVGDFVGPVAYRKGLDLSEVTVLLCLVFWYSVWGAAGAVLAVPLTCAIKIALEEMPHAGAKMVARMMAPRLKRRRPSASVRAALANESSLSFRTRGGRDERPMSTEANPNEEDADGDDDDEAYERGNPRTPYTVRAARWTWRKVNPTKPSSSGYRRLEEDGNE